MYTTSTSFKDLELSRSILVDNMYLFLHGKGYRVVLVLYYIEPSIVNILLSLLKLRAISLSLGVYSSSIVSIVRLILIEPSNMTKLVVIEVVV
jgi:hypothetical protein